MTDTERFDWLEKNVRGGALLHNDFNHWAVVSDGMQNCPDEDSDYGKTPFPLETTFFCDELEVFKPTIREAIDFAIENWDWE